MTRRCLWAKVCGKEDGKGLDAMQKTVVAILATALIAGCVGGGDGIRRLNSGQGPDEFSVQPALPLVIPEQLALPEPGGVNRAETNPRAEAVAALGGSLSATVAGGIPSRDAALVTYVSRNGVSPDIRATVAAEDAAIRGNGRWANLFNFLGRDRYYRVYANQALDAYAELQRFRNLGVAVPTAPPQN